MKRTIILTISLLALCAGAFAANPDAKKITVGDRQIEQRGDSVYVEFDVAIGKRVARGGYTVVYRPYLVSGEHRWDLPEVVVRNPRANFTEQRHEWVSGEKTVYANPTVVRAGEKFRYSAAVPRQGWMKGADLTAEIINIGCCTTEPGTPDLLAQNIDLPTPMGIIQIAPEAAPVAEKPAGTTGDLLAKELPFVLHASEFESTMPELMFDDDREDALKVHFAVGSAVLDPKMDNNARTLALLLDAIRKLEESADSRVEHVVVAGFASPEGAFDLNDRLAWNRASALKKYIVDHSTLDSETIHIYNGVEDWYGLRMMVEASNMDYKQEVLDIIRDVPIWDPARLTGREIELRKVDQGRAYRYMLRNFFPELRKAAYIKVYYGNN